MGNPAFRIRTHEVYVKNNDGACEIVCRNAWRKEALDLPTRQSIW